MCNFGNNVHPDPVGFENYKMPVSLKNDGLDSGLVKDALEENIIKNVPMVSTSSSGTIDTQPTDTVPLGEVAVKTTGSNNSDPQNQLLRSTIMEPTAASTTGATADSLASTGTAVDTSAMSALADRANALFYQVMEMNLAYEEATAGAKAAKAKSGQVSG